MDRRFATAALAGALLAGASTARAQDNVHWPRQHAAPPVSQSVPGALAPPPSPAENRHGAEHTTGEIDPGDYTAGGTYEEGGFEARVGADGRVRFRDKAVESDSFAIPTLIMVFGRFDVTDMAMRMFGEDPYRYQKQRFLDRTFEARARMRMRNDRVVMARALQKLPGYLGRIWRYQRWDPALRKRVLFALWDECAEGGNAFMIESGARARGLIESYIREALPPGSPHAYSAEELEGLNRIRTSETPFAPYRQVTARR